VHHRLDVVRRQRLAAEGGGQQQPTESTIPTETVPVDPTATSVVPEPAAAVADAVTPPPAVE